jgi:hypothetical protein
VTAREEFSIINTANNVNKIIIFNTKISLGNGTGQASLNTGLPLNNKGTKTRHGLKPRNTRNHLPPVSRRLVAPKQTKAEGTCLHPLSSDFGETSWRSQPWRFILIKLAHPGFGRKVPMLTEHRLPGVRLPPDGAFPLLLFPALQCRSRIGGPETSVKQDQKEQNYDHSHR